MATLSDGMLSSSTQLGPGLRGEDKPRGQYTNTFNNRDITDLERVLRIVLKGHNGLDPSNAYDYFEREIFNDTRSVQMIAKPEYKKNVLVLLAKVSLLRSTLLALSRCFLSLCHSLIRGGPVSHARWPPPPFSRFMWQFLIHCGTGFA